MRVAAHYMAWLMGLAEAETQTTVRERDCLAAHAAGRRRLVEIGVWHGVTTARRQLDQVPGGRVRWLRTTGADAAKHHGSVDFIFIDGDHSEAGLLADWEAWSGLLETGGIVALHDSRSTPERPIDEAGSVKVTNRVILRDARFEPVDEVDSLTVLRRR